ncbi:M10 family metallopeptidase C-terminal domain-containing protein [Anabaena lutea]|uniref:M10 family metallopeptidase C-terminal domain-containing protein n=1 Tax=Anabaena lutea FACHB-196 TaxID=2692881 RepID=A0ABR8FGM3_9NOST|nr:M10 family metallopeptidase C-terminal domain-containing protein [Anabaena lutea]MBD2568896.1 M10 family metallopeptidase C-terminal domain-containing protein [Anabaena lutea FACHB-196]
MNTLLNSALTLTYSQLSAFSGLDNFWQVFDTTFGTAYNRSVAEILRLQWQAGDFSQIPQIEIIDSSILGTANGAYASSTNKIYLSDTFVKAATLEAISTLLLEEIGHFVDAQINQTDSVGDEGAIFAELVQGNSLDDATLQALQAENDHATITVNGQTIQVEQQDFTGTSSGEEIKGTSGDDTIEGLGGNDTLLGEGGNDQLFGGTGSDTLTGGTGLDQFVFEYFDGSSLSQDLDVVADFVKGQDKIDLRNVGIADYQTLSYLISDDSLSNAVIAARYSNSSNPIYGYRLRINGLSSSQLAATDFIFSTSVVNDTITGTGGSDDLFGGLGNDTLQGGANPDRLFGEQGDDRFLGGSDSDTFYGGTGLDTFVFEYFNGSSLSQDLDVVADFVKGQDKIDLRTVGIADYQTLLTLISDDSLGNAVIAARYSNSSNSIYGYRLRIDGLSSSQLAATDFIFSTSVVNDNFTATNSSDDLFGGLGNDTLQGSGGNDRLFGEQGDDRFLGGTDSDTFYGGTGLDQFIFEYFNGSSLSQDLDVVTDFVKGQDKIDLRTVGIADYQTLLTLISDDSLGNAVIAARYSNSSNSIYGYRLRIDGLSSSQLAATDFIFSTSVVNDNFTATNNSDDLFGGLGNDTLQGSGGNDRLFGEQGDDRLVGGVGNDSLYGGVGSDTAVYSGTRSQYQISSNAGVFTITDSVSNRDGIDTLYDVEKVQFSDQIITIGNVALPSITLAVSPASVTEDGTANLIYTFTRTGSTTNALTVNYSIGGTAASTDYTGATPGTGKTITFAAGSSTATLTINPTADTTVEANETVALTLATGTGYTVGTTTAVTGTITNDDTSSAITINLSADQTIVEGLTSPQNVRYTITLSSSSTQSITVNYATSNGTATAGSDYTTKTGTLTFAPGTTSQFIDIPIVNDANNEPNETFTLTLSSPTNASLGTKTTATTTITDTLNASATTTLAAGVENLTLTGTAAINGTGNAGSNVLRGNSANNTLAGGNGNDTYAFLANTALGTDTITETATGGTDTLDFTDTTAAVKVNLGTTTTQTVNSNLKLVLSANNVIENATGGNGNDRLTGNSLNNLLVGGAGNDLLQGLAGNDTLWGGNGDDILTGGVGVDQFRFQGSGVFNANLGVDYITDFTVGQDKIALSKATFNAITNAVGQALTNFAVVANDGLVDASTARIVYSQETGSIFYNQNANVLNAAAVFEFAYLSNPDITLSSSDFVLIA